MGRFSETEALVLTWTDVGEEDRIVSFLTRDHGLLRAGASGARNLAKGRAASYDLFSRVRLILYTSSRAGRLMRIRSVEMLDPHLPLRESYERLCAASYIAETASRSVPEGDPAPAAWNLVLLCLDMLRKGGKEPFVLLLFEVRFLREMGWLPELARCQDCGEKVEGEAVLSPAAGGVLHPRCAGGKAEGSLTRGRLAALRHLARGSLSSARNLALPSREAGALFQTVHTFTLHQTGFQPRAASFLKVVLESAQEAPRQTSPQGKNVTKTPF